ncbi:hypothetical protein [Saccharibacillus brassicae]|uniref:Uncharacterized protein n=1 Tax=Saccharibacillus brassicae TaxID=2583377 RepID=A0A4Y6V411_SACBS|nr:hypothetical protein [Saccharibacillus brassicae]QDH23371.1 hypothetical protein FFV09_22395 [Saccharibacillus brassicae]
MRNKFFAFSFLFMFLSMLVLNPQVQAATTQNQAAIYINPADLEIYSYDGRTFLGTLSTNTYDPDSVFNKYGLYGSKYRIDSIWNQYGLFGSDYSLTSAWNKYTVTPPILVYDGEIVGYVSANKSLSYAFHPNVLWKLAKSF